MAKQRLGTEFKLQLRTAYDTVDCTMHVELEGSKVPNLELVGQAFEHARETFQAAITAAYKAKPEGPAPTPIPEPTSTRV
jgi:hypothetical protein